MTRMFPGAPVIPASTRNMRVEKEFAQEERDAGATSRETVWGGFADAGSGLPETQRPGLA